MPEEAPATTEAVPAPKAPPAPTAAEALMSRTEAGSERLGFIGSIPEALREQSKLGERLSKLRNEGREGRDLIEAARTPREAKFGKTEQEELLLSFGAGKAQRTETGSIELNLDGLTDREKAIAQEIFGESQNIVAQLRTILEYNRALAEIARREAQLPESMRGLRPWLSYAPELGIDSAELLRMRNVSVESLESLPALRALIPELDEVTDEHARRELIRITLAADPKLRTRIAERLQAIQQRAKALPEVQTDPEYEQNKKDRESSIVRLESATREVAQYLKDTGIPGEEDEWQQRVKELVERGMATDHILTTIQKELFDRDPEYRQIYEYNQKKQQMETLRARWEGMKTRDNADAAGAAKTAFEEAKEEFDKVTGIESQPDFSTKREVLSKILATTSTQKDASGLYTNVFGNTVNELVKVKRQRDELDRKIAEKGPKAQEAEERSRLERLRQEAALRDDLELVLSESVMDVLGDRMDELRRLQHVEIAKKEEEAKKSGDEAVTAGVKRVGEAIKTNWITYNERDRSKKWDRQKIGNDVRFLAYHGKEDGIKRLMLRDLNLKQILTDESGVTTEASIDWRTVDFDSLSDEQKKVLNAVYEKHGQMYKDRLLGDFFQVRDLRDRGVMGRFGAMNLKKHEYELLEQHFGEDLDKSLQQSEKAQEILKDMEQKGIKPTFKMKWMLLMLLGGVLTAGIAPTIAMKRAIK